VSLNFNIFIRQSSSYSFESITLLQRRTLFGSLMGNGLKRLSKAHQDLVLAIAQQLMPLLKYVLVDTTCTFRYNVFGTPNCRADTHALLTCTALRMILGEHAGDDDDDDARPLYNFRSYKSWLSSDMQQALERGSRLGSNEITRTRRSLAPGDGNRCRRIVVVSSRRCNVMPTTDNIVGTLSASRCRHDYHNISIAASFCLFVVDDQVRRSQRRLHGGNRSWRSQRTHRVVRQIQLVRRRQHAQYELVLQVFQTLWQGDTKWRRSV
jgi:hypothetical protein